MRRIVCTFLLFLFIITVFKFSQATEREILLQFKGNITHDPYNSLSTWVSSNNNNPCRDFIGVVCNPNGFVDKIVLWNRSLGGVLSPALSGLKSLRVLSLFGNRFTGNIPSDYSRLQTLWKINLSSNALSGSIPEFIGDLPNIRFLDLSKNGYVGEIPVSLFKHCYKTKFVSLSRNNLSGSVPSSILNCSNLEGFDFSYNALSGELPKIGNLPTLQYVSLRGNVLIGSVREELWKCKRLKNLDLSSNLFAGLAPFQILEFINMTYFNVSDNRFRGGIPELGSCSERLEFLDASSNDLDGGIPISIVNCKSLKLLDFEYNRLNGSIPGALVNLQKLSVIRLGNNSIEGNIPEKIGNMELLEVLNLHNLKLRGNIPDYISNCTILLELDISGNSLEGEIPKTLDYLTNLKILDLHRNQLSGTIPPSIGNLSKIEYLDLSQNVLSGSIPLSLGNLKELTYFNLSYNNLSGMIPSGSTIGEFGASSFINNSLLCGAPLETPCSGNSDASSDHATKSLLSVSVIIAIVAAALILTGVCVITIMNMRARKRRQYVEERMVVESTPLGSTGSNVSIRKLVLFSKSLPSRYEDWEAGTKALIDKECLIGGGSIGTVYKTTFEGGVSIAVKKLETLGRIRNRDEFEHEIGRLGNLEHSNLVAFQGYYWSSAMQLILSEFVSNGNLYDHLHGLSTSTSSGNSELNWPRRFSIAFKIARAISYLHHDCTPPVLHLNIKSTNILLDGQYEPKLSDYGLSKLLPVLDDNYGFHNAVGYVAPELAQSLRVSEKCDVYSYGVILLELITGKKPVESPRAHEVVILCEYVKGLLERGRASDCFDTSLSGFAENEVVQVMKLGLICTSQAPLRRPSMVEVVQVLESIRNGMGSY